MSFEYVQQVAILAARNPLMIGDKTNLKSFEISPPDYQVISDMNESVGAHYFYPTGTTDESIGMGTISLARVFVIKPFHDTTFKFVNAEGTSQSLTFKAETLSIIHCEFTDILISNDSGDDISGIYFIAGD